MTCSPFVSFLNISGLAKVHIAARSDVVTVVE